MNQNIKSPKSLFVVIGISIIFMLMANNTYTNFIFATDQLIIKPILSVKGTIIPHTVINPITGEYILTGNWNMDVKEGKIVNFTADVIVELYNGSNPHSHQFTNFRQVEGEIFSLTTDNSGAIRGNMDLGLNNDIVHRNVSTTITIDRGVVLSVSPDIVDLGIQPIIYGLTESKSNELSGQKLTENDSISAVKKVIDAFNTGNVSNVSDFISEEYFNHESQRPC
jgi:hypothetical protein